MKTPALSAAASANQQFLTRRTYDPWVLSSISGFNIAPLYLTDGRKSYLIDGGGKPIQKFTAGVYVDNSLQPGAPEKDAAAQGQAGLFEQTLDMRTGKLTTHLPEGSQILSLPGFQPPDWAKIWDQSDIVITGDPEAQQVVHSSLFYLLSSTYPGSPHSIPPMGLSSAVYKGHIFWDAEIWMFPALIAQHPEYAKSILDYRFARLGQARKNAAKHKFAGAEYPWESAETGEEVAPEEFAKERHITADVAYAAWQYYLWTGDKKYLREEGWPMIQATAQYWASRVTKDGDDSYHIRQIMSPDETAGLVDDDAWTNAVVRYNLNAATAAAAALGLPADPKWTDIADALITLSDSDRGIPAEHAGDITERFAAKQADTLLMIHPLNEKFDATTTGRMLDFYAAHTIKTGPAMTSCIHSIVASELDRGSEALDYFRESYRPFMRGPWNAFSEKRTTNNVYFHTGMGGSLQSVLYGFAGLQVRSGGQGGPGKRLAGDNDVSLCANPHLPPGWTRLTVKGVRFRGQVLDIDINGKNEASVTRRGT
ncbi:MAG: glycosyl hydrolase family 65 protein [Capsulimonas sp.]|uniref:glycosyl hydrolase family 95 catalytic domain-containing protein n=1 Tax=Capsulimonas sp. TaxID=2494211 RepID=UPI003263E795